MSRPQTRAGKGRVFVAFYYDSDTSASCSWSTEKRLILNPSDITDSVALSALFFCSFREAG